MSSTTVAQFAYELKKSATTLLEQLRLAGVPKSSVTDILTDSDKHSLLNYLQSSHGTTSPDRKKITLVKKQTSEIKESDASDKARTVQVEVRKKRTFVRRDDEVTPAARLENHAKAQVNIQNNVPNDVVLRVLSDVQDVLIRREERATKDAFILSMTKKHMLVHRDNRVVVLNKLRLQNFRCFSNLEISLAPHLTVLVAENGCGKSTILDAIRIALWPYVSSFDLARNATSDSGNGISISDTRLLKLPSGDMARQLPVKIAVTGNLANRSENTWWERFRDSEAKLSKTKDKGSISAIKKWVDSIQNHIRDPARPVLDLPVFGNYGTGRLSAQKRLTEETKGKDNTKNDDFYVRTFAYINCLEPASSYKHFKEWFIWAFESYREQQIKQLENKANIDIISTAHERIQVVQKAIDTFLRPITGWHTLEYSISHEKSLVLHHDTLGIMDVDLLSDGIRSVLAMIGDIAYRCIKLNPHLGAEAALKTSGIILIDEVDMHLHPRWQQVILGQLREAFPLVQFIVTTHSPQILSSVDKSCIRVIQGDAVKTIDFQTKGVSSADLLARIMDINPIPDIPETVMLSDYHALIQQNLHEDEDGKAMRKKLEAHFGENHPLMRECDRMIRLQAFKQQLPKLPRSKGSE
jgi:predicted ATP-binding protein involved in virulence